MKRIVLPFSVMAFGLLTFVLLILSPLVSLSLLLLFHFGLQVALVTLLTVLFRKNKKRRVIKLRGEKIYGDVDLGTQFTPFVGKLNASQGHW